MLIDFSFFQRNKNYALLYMGQVVSFFGTTMTNVALPWQIYSITHSVIMIGFLSLCQLLPLLITALLGGVLADHYPRRKLLLMAEMVLALCCLLLVWNAMQRSPSVLIIFLIATIMSALNGLHRPALEGLTQQLVKKEDFPTVGALTGLKFNLSVIGAPAIGGILIAHAGLLWTYQIDFFTFLISFLALFIMRIPPFVTIKQKPSILGALKEGLNYAVRRQELMGSYCVDFVAMIFGMPIALFPVLATHWGGANILGLLYSAPAVGALCVSLLSGWTKKINRYGIAIALAACGWGLAIILFGFSHQLILALFFLALAGGFDEISAIFRMTLWNVSIPNHMRGRLAGIEMISYLSGPKLGDTESSLVASALGTTFSIVSGGVLCIVGVVVSCYYFPKFLKYEKNKD